MFDPLSRWLRGRPLSARRQTTDARKRWVRPTLERLEDRLAPAVYGVNTLADPSIAGGVNFATGVITGTTDTVSLRSAIQASNNTTGPNTINLTLPGTYAIALNGPTDNTNATGEFAILNNSVSIQNTSGSAVVIDGGTGGSRVFDIAPDASTDNISVIIGSLLTPSITIQHGNIDSDGGGIRVAGSSGNPNNSTLTLNNVIVTQNSTSGGVHDGGGISLSGNGSVTLNGSTVSDNQSTDATGGGIVADNTGGGGAIIVNNSTITDNVASGDGGGINVVAGRRGSTTVTVTNSTISDNVSDGSGGGINSDYPSTITVTASLIVGNKAEGGGDGGGINAPDGTAVSITDSEITGNLSTGAGGGLAVTGARKS